MTDIDTTQIKQQSFGTSSAGTHTPGKGDDLAGTADMLDNKPDLLARMDYTLAEAVERVGPEWMARVPEAARVLEHEAELAQEAAAIEQARKRNRGMDIGF